MFSKLDVMSDDLETIIGDIVWRKNEAPRGSAAWRMYVRQLAGLRYAHEDAERLIGWLDPVYWGDSVRPHSAPSSYRSGAASEPIAPAPKNPNGSA